MKQEQVRRQPSRLERERRREQRELATTETALRADATSLDNVDHVLADIDEALTSAA